jgi:hypothetical protein
MCGQESPTQIFQMPKVQKVGKRMKEKVAALVFTQSKRLFETSNRIHFLRLPDCLQSERKTYKNY